MSDILINKLTVFRGKDISITPSIVMHHPTLDEIFDYGEGEYYSMVRMLSATPSDLIYQLTSIGVDFTEIDDYEMFCLLLHDSYDSEATKLLFGPSLDFSAMKLWKKETSNEPILVDTEKGIIFDRLTHRLMTDYLREMHGFKKNMDMPANKSAKRGMIEEAEEDYLISKDKPFSSFLYPLISTMVVMPGFKHDENTVFNMKIGAFMSACNKIIKVKNTDLVLQSGYSGFGIDLKKIDKETKDYFGSM